MKKINISRRNFIIILISVTVLLMTGCKNIIKYEQHGWIITVRPNTSKLIITKEELNKVVDEVQLTLKKGNKIAYLSEWTVEKEGRQLIINTKKPQQTLWKFNLTEEAIDVVCSHEDAFITGIAPAGEERIPARIRSQDNGIMYTQMGFVSATNIYNLFDMQTDIMLRFPEASKLTRNKDDNSLMNIQLPVTSDKEFSIIKNYYTDVIGLSDYQKTDFKPVYKPIPDRFETAPTGWSSWYCYYTCATQEDLVKETNALAEKLKPYGLEYVHLDVGYTRGEEANWLEWNKEMYPKGGKWWFDHIKEKGLKPGLWLNAYGANYANPSMADEYPEEFFLRDTAGNLSKACCTVDTTVVRLDYTNPEVIEKHLKPLINELVNDWGLTYLKSAGWGMWMDYYMENRENAYNPDIDSREAYINVQAAIREEMGEENYIKGCAQHEVGIGFGYFDGSVNGRDTYAKWYKSEHYGLSMQNCFKSLFGNNYLNGICWWNDTQDPMIRDPLNMDEAKTIVSSISLSGQAYMMSDYIAEFSKKRLQNFLHCDYEKNPNLGFAEYYPDKVKALPDEKLELYRKTMPTMRIRAMDLYPFKCEPVGLPVPKEYPRALDLKINSESGIYDVVALYNWSDKNAVKILDLQKDLGLEKNCKYLIFDFWNQKLLGIFNEMIKQKVPAHGTKALIIREVSENPQLLATSRHLTAAYSIQEMKWNEEKKSLTGTSKTVPGDKYTLFIHIPDNFEFDKTYINAENVIRELNSDGVLKVSFTGKEKLVDWKIAFKN